MVERARCIEELPDGVCGCGGWKTCALRPDTWWGLAWEL